MAASVNMEFAAILLDARTPRTAGAVACLILSACLILALGTELQ